tara:strand:- start:80 stop:670 length:591 start_codon:yes stop_codon:yes gene_type:complete
MRKIKVKIKKIFFSSIFLIMGSGIYAGNDFVCRKMVKKNVLEYGAMYGAFYTLGYNDAKNKKMDKEFDEIMKKIVKYIKTGCEKFPKSNIVSLFRKGIKSGYAKSDFTKREFKQTEFDTILYKLSGGSDIDTRECIKINLTEDLVRIIKTKFNELEKVCGKNCKRYKRKDLRNIFLNNEGKIFDKEFKLAYKKCKL